METIATQNITLPRLGLGTFRMRGDECRKAVESALELGYRHIDTAEMYENEDAIGAALASAGVPRGALHVTTKVWHDHFTPAAIRMALEGSLAKLKLDYVDLFLIHWPSPVMDLAKAMDTLQRLQEEGRIRALGVANFTVPLLKHAVEELGAPIACNQVEYHPFLDQSALLAYMRTRNIPLTAYCPLAQGKVAKDETLARIGKTYGKSAAQVGLRWLLQQEGVVAIPKARHRESQQANLEALNFTLAAEDMRAIDALPKNQRLVNPPFAPEWDEARAA